MNALAVKAALKFVKKAQLQLKRFNHFFKKNYP